MRRHVVSCARLVFSALGRRLCGRAWAIAPPSGTVRLPGLRRNVAIRRDDAGIPHIFAETLQDLGFGAGVAMAQDRLWQMETLRRLAFGRVAEVAGDRRIEGGGLHLAAPSILAMDQLYRSLRFERLAQDELTQVSEDGRRLLEGFARGVNGWVERCRASDLPPEFLLAGIDPDPWRPEDTLAVGKLIGWLLSLAFVAKPTIGTLARHPALTPLIPPHLRDGLCIVGGPPPPEPGGLDCLARHALGLLGPGTGSNSWVLGGGRTASGKPILCNDPHLVFGLPALWYPLALSLPTHRVIGATMAGIPGVLIGRNDHLAWGVTAVMADDGDYYRETLDPAGDRYVRGNEWQAVETMPEVFRVRGRRHPVHLALRYVRHEGVLCPLLSGGTEAVPTSYRWVGFEAWRGLDGLLAMNRATTLRAFEAALEDMAVPAQNIVAADTSGAYGYFCAGKFPRRAHVRSRMSTLNGSNPEHAWGGYLSWAEHPRAVDPPEGYVVTANNRMAADLPPTLAGGFWEPPYRATRIASILRGTREASLEDMERLQADVISLQAAGLVANLLRSTRRLLRDARARAAADLLCDWDYRMGADSPAAALYHLFYRELLQRCIRPPMEARAPGLFHRYLSTLHLAVPAVDTALLTGNATCFSTGTVAVVEECLAAGWAAARARLGPDPSRWHWGALHRLTLYHMLGRGAGRVVRFLAWLFALNRGPFPRGGDGMTINLGAYMLTAPFEIGAGPSYRQLVDLAAPEASRWIIAGGVSGDPRSRHYADQLPQWLEGDTRPMRFLEMPGPGDRALRLVPADCAASSCVL